MSVQYIMVQTAVTTVSILTAATIALVMRAITLMMMESNAMVMCSKYMYHVVHVLSLMTLSHIKHRAIS